MNSGKRMLVRALALTLCLASVLLWAAWHEPAPIQGLSSRYQKVNAQGEAVAEWSGPWACVFDHETGRLWEVKGDNEGIHDGYWSYSWFNGQTGQPNAGDCFFEAERCDTMDLVRRTNEQALCGVSRWRLPSRLELQSLVENDVQPGQAKIAAAFFPHTKKGDYWTSDGEQELSGHFARLDEGAVAVSFRDGSTSVLPYRNAAFVRLVADHAASPARNTNKSVSP